MKLLVVISIFLITFSNLKGQCTLTTILPVQLGITKFAARNKINSTKLFTRREYADILEQPTFIKPKRIKGDSIKIEKLVYQAKSNDCISGKEMTIELSFADDLLYHIEFEANLDEAEYNSCIADYERITQLLDNSFLKYKKKIKTTDMTTDDVIGEGNRYLFSSNPKTYKNFEIGYKFSQRKPIVGNITRNYLLSYEQVDLSFTKIDATEGY